MAALTILHINCNYNGQLHKVMLNHLRKNTRNNYLVFYPTYINTVKESEKDVIISNCFKKNDRFFYFIKSNKIFNAIQNNYDFNKVDIIHAHTLFTDGNIAYKLNKKYKIPYIVAIRNTDINTFFKYRKLLKNRGIKILDNASKIIFISKSYKIQLFNQYLSKKQRIKYEKKSIIIPNGIDDYWLNNICKKRSILNANEPIKFIYVGRIEKNKNIEGAQKAIKLFREQDHKTEFTIIGEKTDENYYNLISKYPNTTYLPYMKKEELIKLYKNSHIFIMPSFHETFGLVYAEAMSQGLPILYTERQGFDGWFNEGEVGYPVNPTDYNDISKKIIKIITNYRKISDHCRKNAQLFNWNRICEKYDDIYRTIYDSKISQQKVKTNEKK